MRHRGRIWALTALASLTLAATAAVASPSVFPTGTLRYDPQKAYSGYVLFSGADEKTHLIDMTGAEVKRWDYPGFPAGLLDPRLTGGQPGHVVVQNAKQEDVASGTVPGQSARFRNQSIAELDWDGKLVWQWGGEQAPGGAALQHHDWSRLDNGNTLVLSSLTHPVAGFTLAKLQDDVVYEVSPAGAVVWRWVASEHLEEFGFSPEELALVKKTEKADFLHLNNMKRVGPNRWFDAGDKRFAPDNVLIDSREANFIAIIDKASGKVVWHLGPHYPARPRRNPTLPRPVDQISGQHDAHLIPPGLPGAGNLLVFDNQGKAGYPTAELQMFPASRVLEIDPVRQEIVWEYSGDDSDRPSWTFHSAFISDARRLPNGNTFIDEGMTGRFFQITPQGEIVWEYVSPYFGRSGSGSGSDKRQILSNQVYRGQPVPYDWVPAGTPHAEQPVVPPDPASFRVPTAP